MPYPQRRFLPLRSENPSVSILILAFSLSLAIVSPNETSARSQQQNESRAATLEPRNPIKSEMRGGQMHAYLINANAGQYFHVIVEQRGINVALALFTPDGKKLIEVDRADGAQGHESASFIAGTSGTYRLKVNSHSKDAAPGKYEARIEELRAATDQDRNRIAAQTLLTEGEQLHARGDEESLQSALRKYEESLSLYRTTGDTYGEAHALSKLGQVYYSTGEIKKALDEWGQELSLRRAAGDRAGEAHALSNVGKAYNDVGEKQKALDCDNQALLLHRETGDRIGETNVLINIGWVYYSIHESHKALNYYHQALSLSGSLGHHEGEARALLGIGATYTSLGEKRKALGYGHQALSLNRAIGARREEAYTLHNLGWLYGDLGEKQKALDYNHQALPLMRDVGDLRGEAYILHSIGWIYDSSGEKQKAIDYYKQALPFRRAIGDYIGEADTLYRLAQCEREGGNLIEARAHIDATINLIESLRAKIGSPELRATYIAHAQAYYEFYIDLLSQLHQRSPAEGYDAAALQTSERARARRLLELLIEARADIRQGVDTALLERERNLRQIITTKTNSRVRLLNGKHTEQQAARAREELEALTSAYQEVEAKIRNTSPRYAALTQPRPLALPEIQRLLDPDTLLLEYALGGVRSHLWAVTPTSIKSFELEKGAVINDATQRVYELLTARAKRLPGETAAQRKARVAKADARYPAAAAELSRLLLAPVASQLGNKRLVIVSDGALQYIPFAALPEPAGGKHLSEGSSKRLDSRLRTPGTGLPLIVGHEIVTLPSASTLALLRRDLEGRKSPTKAVAVFADPVFEATDVRVIQKSKSGGHASEKPAGQSISLTAQTGGDDKTRQGERQLKAIKDYLLRTRMIEEGQPLARLPYSRKEAMTIASLVPEGQRKIALDFDVNYQTVIGAKLGEYRFVHFATHGLLDTEQPELSGILLSLVDREGRPQESGILRLGDVYNLKMPVDMVSLSACETALGKSVRGEGLVGLTRGFMYAGAPRVLASLWKVEEAATAELMVTFYEGVLGKQQLRPAAALRRAQVEMWRKLNRRAPYYWGAFVLQGEWK